MKINGTRAVADFHFRPPAQGFRSRSVRWSFRRRRNDYGGRIGATSPPSTGSERHFRVFRLVHG